MPFIPKAEKDYSPIIPLLRAEQGEPTPTLGETVSAAFRKENSLISAIDRGLTFNQFPPEDGYDALEEEVLGEYKLYATSFIKSRSRAETAHIKSRIDKQQQDRELLASGGIAGGVAQIVAALTDPVLMPLLFIPGGQLVSAGKVGKSALKLGTAGGISESAAEGLKHATQEVRTVEESLINITGVTLLSGVMGAAIGAMSRQEIKRVASNLDDIMRDPEAQFDAPRTVGAQQVATTLEQETPAGALGLEQIGVTPEVRTANSPSVRVRQLLQELTDSSVVTQKNFDGITGVPEGGSVENRVKQWMVPLYQATLQADELYLAYRGATSKVGTALTDLVRGTRGKMSRREFNEAVGKAMRRGDVDEIPEVQAAADFYRKTLFDPLKDAAIDAGMLPPEVTTETALSYLTRVYHTGKIKADGEFKEVLVKWLRSEQQNIETKLAITSKQVEAITEELPSIQRAGTQAVKDVAEIRKKVKELRQNNEVLQTRLKELKKTEELLSQEMQVLINRFNNFVPTDEKAAVEFRGKISTTQNKLNKVNEKETALLAQEEAHLVEMQELLTRFGKAKVPAEFIRTKPTDAGIDLIITKSPEHKAITQRIETTQKKLRKIRDGLAKTGADRERLLSDMDNLSTQLNFVGSGNVSRARELSVSISRIRKNLNKYTENTAITRTALDENIIQHNLARKESVTVTARRNAAERTRKVTERELVKKGGRQSDLEKLMLAGDSELESIAEDVINNMLLSSASRIPYEASDFTKGVFKERTLLIPDELIEKWLESDIDMIARQYTRTMAPDVELARMFETTGMQKAIQEIKEQYATLIDAAESGKAKTKLRNRMASDIRDMEAMRDRLRGTFGSPADPDSFWARAGRVIRDVNFLSKMGEVVLSSIPDVARPIMINGLRPAAKGLMTLAFSPRRFKMAREEAKLFGAGLEMVTNARLHSQAELTDVYANSTRVERWLRAGSDAFGKITLITPWNAAMKQTTGVITSHRIMEQVLKSADGTISKSMKARLAQSGIDEQTAIEIAEQVTKHADRDGTLWLSNWSEWENGLAKDSMRAAVLKDVEQAIVTPGVGDRPLWMSAEMGKMIGQFKSFSFSANQ
ncbi:MAG: hypothetical protein KAS32_02645, partial [Candidatus Peribacteraceae bacterium]|nr:hypothetical protein [Candidatus Peribacteraceae bacterium]